MSGVTTKASASFGLLLGVGSGAWSAIVAFLCVPWYVSLLGIESYGLIGFFVTLQAVIGLLDLGVGATINREVARSAALGDLDHARRLLRSLELVYAAVAVVIAIAIAAAAPLIAAYWLEPGALNRDEMETALRLMGVVAALRWPVGLYQGALIGLHQAPICYRANVVLATLANVGAVLILLFAFRSLQAFFIWQALCALSFVVWMKRSAWGRLGSTIAARFDWVLLKGVLIKSIMMSGVAISGVILAQLDKFVVSASTTLADFGRYSLASVLAGGLAILVIPTFNLIYPRLSALFASGEKCDQIKLYRLGTRLFASFIAPIALSAFFYSSDVLTFWTGNAALVPATAPIVGWLCLGSALNGLMHFPYALQLAAGRTRLAFLTNCVLVAIMLPLTITLVENYGALGGAFAWFSLNAMYVVIGVTVTHRYILPGLQTQWLLNDVAPAALLSGVLVSAGYYAATAAALDSVWRLLAATIVSLLATSILLLIPRDTRGLVAGAWNSATSRLVCRNPAT